VLWSTISGDLRHLFVAERGWDRDRFATWLANLWKRTLLEPRYH